MNDPSRLSPEERVEVIVELRRRAQSSDGKQNTARIFLLRLGDPDTIGEVLNVFRKGRGDVTDYEQQERYGQVVEALRSCRQPLVVPLLAEVVMIDEPYASDPYFGRLPRSFDAVFLIRDIVKECMEFNPEVRSWQGFYGYSHEQSKEDLKKHGITCRASECSWLHSRCLMRVWWQQNKEHFAKQDYAAVTPLPPVTNAVPPVRSVAGIVPPNTSAPPAVAKVQATPQPVSTPAVPAEAPSPSNSSWRLPVVIAIVAMLGIVFALLKRRQR